MAKSERHSHMRKAILPALALAFSACLALGDDLPKFKKLKLKSGREYEKVAVTEKRPDGISITHVSGTARIRFEDLPDEVVKQFGGFDAAAATKARAEADAREAATLAEIDRGIKSEGEAKQPPASVPTAEAKAAFVKIKQTGSRGGLCKVAWMEADGFVMSKDSFGRPVKGAPKFSAKQFQESEVFVYGLTGVDNDGFEVALIPVAEPYVYGEGRFKVRAYQLSGQARPSTKTPKEHYEIYRSSNPPASSMQRVGGG